MFELNLESDKKLGKCYGDLMTLNDFIEDCKGGSFIDYDGFASEIILNGFVVYDKAFYPSDVLTHKNKLLNLQKEHGQLKVVWYNR